MELLAVVGCSGTCALLFLVASIVVAVGILRRPTVGGLDLERMPMHAVMQEGELSVLEICWLGRPVQLVHDGDQTWLVAPVKAEAPVGLRQVAHEGEGKALADWVEQTSTTGSLDAVDEAAAARMVEAMGRRAGKACLAWQPPDEGATWQRGLDAPESVLTWAILRPGAWRGLAAELHEIAVTIDTGDAGGPSWVR